MAAACSVDGCHASARSRGLCEKHYARVLRAEKAERNCGHGIQVTEGRCWDCHIAHLRSTGDGARADRLVENKRLHDEGAFDFARLVAGTAEMLAEEFARGEGEPCRREAEPLRHGRPG